jgi:hypothetical protein
MPLSIYFGHWTVEDWQNSSKNLVHHDGRPLTKTDMTQVKHFFEVERNRENVLLWVFLEDDVYCLKPVGNEVVNGSPDLQDENSSHPKTLWSEIVGSYSKSGLPDVFANVNANQKYNRKTIVPLEDAEAEIAEHLFQDRDERFQIRESQLHRYLSPLQYETLILLIFVRNDHYCSTWRGGTGEKYDMHVELEHPLRPFPTGSADIQVKKKPSQPDRRFGYWVVHTGHSKFTEKVIGWEWIQEQYRQSRYIMNWLTKSLPLIKVQWDT